MAPDLASVLTGFDLSGDLGGFITSWEGIFTLLEEVTDGDLFGIPIPLVGGQLAQGATFLLDLRDRVKSKLEALDQRTVDWVQRAIFEALGPPGLNWLVDVASAAPNTSGPDDLVTPEDLVTHLAPDLSEIQFDVHLRQRPVLLERAFDFDLGLPALGLDVQGGIRVELGFEFQFGIGLSRNTAGGVYLAVAKANELTVDLKVSLPPGFRAVGTLGFLRLEVSDDPAAPTSLTGAFTVDLQEPSGDGRLTYQELSRAVGGGEFGDLLSATFSAVADWEVRPLLAGAGGGRVGGGVRRARSGGRGNGSV